MRRKPKYVIYRGIKIDLPRGKRSPLARAIHAALWRAAKKGQLARYVD